MLAPFLRLCGIAVWNGGSTGSAGSAGGPTRKRRDTQPRRATVSHHHETTCKMCLAAVSSKVYCLVFFK